MKHVGARGFTIENRTGEDNFHIQTRKWLLFLAFKNTEFRILFCL